MWNKKKHKTHHNQKGGTTLISASTEIHGEVTYEGTMHVEGRIKGNVSSDEGLLTLTENGFIEGDISAPHIKINGTVNGNISCSTHLELSAKAVIKGIVYYNVIEMSPGSEVNGSLEHHEASISAQQSMLAAPEADTIIAKQQDDSINPC